MTVETVDVLIIGAGLSGIGAACHLRRECPDKTFLILERRDAIGGTWDLFRYPGIRSDSDMHTLGYNFKPWTDPKAIADGPAILEYIRETAREYRVEERIRFRHRLRKAEWSSREGRWLVDVDVEAGEGSGATPTDSGVTGSAGGASDAGNGSRAGNSAGSGAGIGASIGTGGEGARSRRFAARFVIGCTGYYNYDAGYTPEFPGRERFKGRVIHPQHWPQDLDYTGQRVIVIGSGATAVTLVPSMAGKAAHVTMLQRSPSYILAVPNADPQAEFLGRFLPARWVYRFARTRNILLSLLLFRLSRAFPERVRKFLLGQVRKELGPLYDARHFSPAYRPWDERLCMVPDSDLFQALRKGRASIVTDHIDTFTENGIRLQSGVDLEADLIVTATGLDIQALGGAELWVDGRPFDVSTKLCYKGLMFEDLPNFGMVFGYTNASWTLKADLTLEYLCRLIRHMDRSGATQVTPRNHDPDLQARPFIDMQSGYIQRAAGVLPHQGHRQPWRLHQNYGLDWMMLHLGRVDDGVLQFSGSGEKHMPASATG